VLEDESGFSLVSPLKRSWAPRGQTPVLRTSLQHHQRLNLLGALLVSWNGRIRLTTRSYRRSVRGEEVVAFLKQILRIVPGEIILVWDNHPIHKRQLVQEFLAQHPRVHLYYFPICAPELNPVEFVWTQVSEYMANFAAHTIAELFKRISTRVARTRNSIKRLMACLKGSELSWK
jgi:transposase